MNNNAEICEFIHHLFGTQDFVPLSAPKFIGNEKKYLNECIDTTFVSSVGAFVDRFEHDMAVYTGAKRTVVCVSGTNALHMAMLLVGVERDDEVLTQALTFIATCNAVSYIGAYPVFIDVNKEMGEVVHKGDTLYSYVLLGNIVNQYDPNILPSAVKETHDMEVQAKLAQQEIPVLRTRLAELRKQKASESSDIYYGLTDNTKRNALDAEIAEVEEELRKQAKKVEIYAQAKNTTYNFMSRRGAGRANASMPYSNTITSSLLNTRVLSLTLIFEM
jgi:cystathionine beta-lyase/cystathionine gamma-synthase